MAKLVLQGRPTGLERPRPECAMTDGECTLRDSTYNLREEEAPYMCMYQGPGVNASRPVQHASREILRASVWVDLILLSG